MNNDDDRISPLPSNDHALEARIVAWVMGEASEFEIAELTRVLAERPALVAFKARIENTHRLLREAAGPEKNPLKLSGDRRAKLMASLGIAPELTAGDESSNEVSFERADPIAADIAAVASAAPAPAAKAKPTEKSSILTYPLARGTSTKSSAWFRGLSIACSLALTFVVLHVTVFAPRPHLTRYASQTSREAKLSNEQKARVKVYADTERVKNLQSGLSAKETLPEQMLSSTSDDKISYKNSPTSPPDVEDFRNRIKSDQQRKWTDWKSENKAIDQSFVSDPQVAPASSEYSTLGNTSAAIPNARIVNGSFSDGASRFVPEHQYATNHKKTWGRNDSPNASPINEEPVPLDSFAVTDSLDSGSYTATSTLAGTRLAPPLPSLATVDIDRGPNSKIFGLGAPGPIDQIKKADSSEPTRRKYVDDVLSKKEPTLPVITPPASDETITLSPFEESAQDSEGYNADSTLAGTRVRTDLKDTSSVITAVTQQFLKDTGAKNNQSRLAYADDSEKGGAEGNFVSTPATPSAGKPAEPERSKKDVSAGPVPSAPALSAKPEYTDEQSAQTQPVSTFSLHVSDVSFRLSADALAAGERPDPTAIRPEEFYNAFDYGDPAPASGEAISCLIEQAAHPTKQQRNLVRIAMRVPSTGRAATQPLRLTLLLDTSGSMQRRDRAASVKDAMSALISLLKPEDQITLIGFARTPHLLAESVAGDNARQLVSIVTKTPAEGGTNLDEALTLAAELAQRHQASGAQNRIVLITDGAANLGDADPKALSDKIEALRQKGIAFDACGVGTSGLDDTMLESLTRHGDGRYLLLDRASASAEFAKQLAGAFRPAAKNVKVQVRFNPNRVAHYRLLGFAQHRLKEEDFRNDKVDAAELAADEAANALYEVEPLPQGEGALGEVFVRFQDVATGQMIERSWTLPYDPKATRFDRASPALQLAGTAALVAEYLEGAPVNLDDLVGVVTQLRNHYRNESRVQTLINMFDQLRRADRRY